MRLQVISDLHVEFHRDCGATFIRDYLKPERTDILVLAGDLGTPATVSVALTALAKHYRNSDIVYVPGNHEFYGTSIAEGLQNLRAISNVLPNVHLLDNEMKCIRGLWFIGTTMWFPRIEGYQAVRSALNDFKMITGFEDTVFKRNRAALRFLRWHLNKHAVVVTHHMPTHKSLAERFVGNPANMFFVCDIEKLLVQRRPKLWIHGHTHASFNYMLGKTQVVCNPLGYAGHSVNQEFIANMLFEV